MQTKAKDVCKTSFQLLHSFLQVLSYNELKINGGFERAFATLFEQDVQTFTSSMLLHLDQLEKQLGKEEFQETRSMDLLSTHAYTRTEYDRRVNKRLMQTQESKVVLGKELDANLVVMESNGTKSGKHDTSSHSGNYITHSVGADIRLVNDQVLFAEVEFLRLLVLGGYLLERYASLRLAHTRSAVIKPTEEYHSHPYECDQTLNVSAGTLNLSSSTSFNPKKERLRTTLQAPSTWSLNVYEMVKLTPGYISSRLVQNSVSPTTYVPPSKRDYEILFQPLFDEYFNPPPCAISPDPVAVAAPRPVDPAGSPHQYIDQGVACEASNKQEEKLHDTKIQQLSKGSVKDLLYVSNDEENKAIRITRLLDDLRVTAAKAVEKSSEVLDQTFDRLQKLISQLEIHGESISQEDVNQKFLRSLSPEWNTHVVVWRNKSELEIMSIDDLYNNLKVYEPEVKGTSSSSTNTQNIAFVSSNNTNSTNGAVNTTHGATTAST
ncbi:hypothetical protein Tco_0627716 [Tanacetum coccineum]|uniref:Uncharacterized protein n=1 Tax=Tanacetum coccineum TaxID=301880 RepID=A0ABQ4WN85_9ASTR